MSVCDGQAYACLIRVNELDSTGAPVTSADSQYVTSGLISLAWTPNTTAGAVIERVSGCGESCLYTVGPDRLNYLDLTLTLCAPEPELLYLLANGTLHTLSGATVGYGAPGTGAQGVGVPDVSVELWSQIIVDGSPAAYVRYVLPRTRGWRQTGTTYGADAVDVVLAGKAFNAGAWGQGPAQDWDLLSDEDVTLLDWALDDETLPTPACGAVTPS